MAVVTYEDERTLLRAVVRPATYRDDLRRLDMHQKASKEVREDNTDLIVAIWTHPRLVCSTPEGELIIDGVPCQWPPTPSDLLNASVDAIDAWYEEVKRLNPKWFEFEGESKKTKET